MRPTKVFRGTQSPLRNCKSGDLDWVIVRENTEGEYAGQGGRSHRGQPWETATELAIFTRHGVERIMRFAFETARSRPRKLLTVVSKSNAQRNGMVLWDEIAAEVGKEYPDVTTDKMLVDAMTCRMVLKPESIDTIVASNLVSLDPIPHPPSLDASICRQANVLSACRYPVRSGRSTCGVDRHCANVESRSHAQEPQHV